MLPRVRDAQDEHLLGRKPNRERVWGAMPVILRTGIGARPRKKRFLYGPLAAGFERVTEFVAANGEVLVPCLDHIAFHVYN
jgi:hypothetical protein